MKLKNYAHAEDKHAFAHAFSLLPGQLRRGRYRNALIPERLEHGLIEMQLPAPRDFWLLEQDGDPIGRIGASLSSRYPQTGYVGFFEVDTSLAGAEKAAQILIEAACGFLQGKASSVYGPVNLNTWLPYRFRVNERDQRCFPWEPVNPPDYVEHFLAAGFEHKVDYHSTAFGNLDQFLEQTESDYEGALAKGFSFRNLDWSRLFEGEASMLYRIANQAFADSFLFESVPQPLFDQSIGQFYKPGQDCSYVAVSLQGHDVGFFYAFTDQHFPSSGAAPETYAVLKSTGVTKQARGQRLSNALAHLVVKSAAAKGAQFAIAALVRSGIQSESYARKGIPFWQHHYALFEKSL